MIFDLAHEVQAPTPGNVDICRVTTGEELEDFVKASELAFGGLDAWQRILSVPQRSYLGA